MILVRIRSEIASELSNHVSKVSSLSEKKVRSGGGGKKKKTAPPSPSKKELSPEGERFLRKKDSDSFSFHGAIAATVNVIGRRSHGGSEFFIPLNNELNVSWRPSTGRGGACRWTQPRATRGRSRRVVGKVSGSDHRFVSRYVESFGSLRRRRGGGKPVE